MCGDFQQFLSFQMHQKPCIYYQYVNPNTLLPTHVCDQQHLVSSICLALSLTVAQGSCGLAHLSIFIMVKW